MDKSMIKGGVFTLIAALVVLIVGGIVMATSARNMQPQVLWTQQLTEGQEVTSGPIEASGQFLGVLVKALIEPNDLQNEGQVKFSIPLTYTVNDSQGSVLATFDGVLDGNTVTLLSNDDEEEMNGFSAGIMEMSGQTYYRILNDQTARIVKSESFPIEKTGTISVTAKLGNETVNGHVLDSTIALRSMRVSGGMFAGCFVCCLVPILLLVGLILLLIGIFK